MSTHTDTYNERVLKKGKTGSNENTQHSDLAF